MEKSLREFLEETFKLAPEAYRNSRPPWKERVIVALACAYGHPWAKKLLDYSDQNGIAAFAATLGIGTIENVHAKIGSHVVKFPTVIEGKICFKSKGLYWEISEELATIKIGNLIVELNEKEIVNYAELKKKRCTLEQWTHLNFILRALIQDGLFDYRFLERTMP
jgi:hypothetical protein